ncbi:MAG: flavodoxin domain-containing protein [Candidatus Thiodiazotropha sp.]
MENRAMTQSILPTHPLDGLQLTRLQQAVEGLNSEQLIWASGYLAGLGAVQPAIGEAANEAPLLTILYATHGGNARGVAEALADGARAWGLAPRLVAAEGYRARDLTKERLLVVVISTQGEGEPPEGAFELFRYLKGNKAPQLDGLKYAVFGLGDSSYEHFCQAAKELDALLQGCGAQALLQRIDADVDFQRQSTAWQGEVLRAVEQLQPSDQARIIPLQRGTTAGIRYDRNHPFQSELLERRRITTTDALSEVHHLALEIDPQAISYRPGDALGVLFRNDPAVVEEILSHTRLSGDTRVKLGDDELTLTQALIERLELTQLHPRLVKAWAALSGDRELSALSEDGEGLRRFVQGLQLIDLLQAYPVELDGQGVVNLLHPRQPRLYSIASSQAAYEDEVHLAVSTLRYRGHGREHLGGASGYLTRRLVAGERLGVYVAENNGFRLPQSGDTPIIMVGAGTGIAPYRAFLQAREAAGAGGDGWLIYGNRHFHRDFLYQADWLNYRKAGLLKRISLAFSRDGKERTYVQARLYEERAELYRWLRQGAHLYVCGGVAMEQGVRQALQAIAQDQGGLDEAAAIEYIESLREQGRYQRDVY